MIQMTEVVKRFGTYTALNGLGCEIENETIYGLVGPNGSGKSTMLRLIAGIYRADQGAVCVDDEPVFENTMLKNDIFYLSDELYFLPQSTMDMMAKFFSGYYNRFSYEIYQDLCRIFPLDTGKKIVTFSKGMQRQAGIILALSCRPKILLLDEAFDGLDPVIRSAVRRLLVNYVAEHEATVIISSHNLRELEDLCDHIGLLHKGRLLLDRDLDTLRLGLCRFHCGFHKAPARDEFRDLQILKFSSRGNLITLTARGNREELEDYLASFNPLFLESLPLTLEEVFIQEMEEAGYDFNNLVL
ncbi:ABC transporter ATP-binding protein [Massiliimalia massiliensis]|jgi:ABC-2 type transport system ATP-binding protein|uniref:ABC transporter ATP-binding protein n=1 Tax=Massiliimalia massiliensis TaxID=1852384 RepID=UPI000986B5D8|nr:ABC transporter ATP-binding protein [Massiliimalia massiliensis]